MTRRRALKVTAGAVGATLPLVHVQTAAAAGKLSMGIWDHWVPAANPVLKGLVDEWAAKNKVDVAIDFIASAGNKIILTQAAEAQARSGHDVLAFDQYAAHQYGDKLTPVNDVVDGLIKQYGPVSKAVIPIRSARCSITSSASSPTCRAKPSPTMTRPTTRPTSRARRP
jgi:ABC-type glycerol-3-phosphate transport system substrate-binding protein